MLKNKVVSETSLVSKQAADDDDDVMDPNDDDLPHYSRVQFPLS